MGRQPWRIDPGLARDLGAALEWTGDDGLDALVERVPERVPCGSTAKLAAMSVGEVPPGADVEDLARRVVEHRTSLASSSPGGGPTPSWSCWVTATLTAALAADAELGAVRVAAIRRIDDRAPVADLHAAVVVGDGDGAWIGDPYFGVATRLPAEPGEASSAATATGHVTVRRDEGERGGWTLDLGLVTWDGELRYRPLAPDLDRGDVRAVCAISVTYTGVPHRPYARLHVDGEVVDVREDERGIALVTRRSAPDTIATTEHATWAEAADDFAARTGVRVDRGAGA
ncbi:MAG TPA: hypothetical protein VHK88_19645 [Aquihabitans sp.]|jgi:hypothetical protein|nr:hypothetical protein [Aquihabitans sp.]